MPIFIPPPVRRVKKCPRCGQLYPKKAESCHHCQHLHDQQLDELKEQIARQHEGNKVIGKLFLWIAALILVGMVISFI